MPYFIYTDLMCSLLDPKLVDLGSTLIYVGAYGPKSFYSPRAIFLKWIGLIKECFCSKWHFNLLILKYWKIIEAFN